MRSDVHVISHGCDVVDDVAVADAVSVLVRVAASVRTSTRVHHSPPNNSCTVSNSRCICTSDMSG